MSRFGGKPPFVKRVAALAACLALVLLAVAPLSQAELVERGDLFVRFSGGIAPTALPRDRLAPIAVRVKGTVKTLSGSTPPALRWISIEINRGGQIDTQGLPICRQSQVEATSSHGALHACRAALVGEGSYVAGTAFPEQASFPSRGRIVAFNSVSEGHPAILAHVYGATPVPTTRIFFFRIRHRQGTFGTILTASLPPSINRYGYLKQISLNLFRVFHYGGRAHSYLSAACAAPAGFPGAVFPFARAAMAFEDGRKLASTLTRSCQVAGG
ncbi:MAG TPA: hypothetical protein VF245_03205 [Solirubrobacterales bacterium]